MYFRPFAQKVILGMISLVISTAGWILPVKAASPNAEIVDVSAGFFHTVALANNGTVYSFGLNNNGQLGVDLSTTFSDKPIKVKKLVDIVSISSGNLHNIALDKQGNVWVWGNNSRGQLGDGTYTKYSRQSDGRLNTAEDHDRSEPAKVSGLPPIVSVFAGENSSFALTTSGEVYAWGNSYLNEINYDQRNPIVGGHEDISFEKSRLSPYKIQGLTHVTQISGAHETFFATDSGGFVWAWGMNNANIYGISLPGLPSGKIISPTKIEGLSNVKNILQFRGAKKAIAYIKDGSVQQWDASGVFSPTTEFEGLQQAVSSGFNIAAISKEGTGLLWTAQTNTWSILPLNNLKRIASTTLSIPTLIAADDKGQLWTWTQNKGAIKIDGFGREDSTVVKIKVDGKDILLQKGAPYIKNDIVFLPLQFISGVVGAKVTMTNVKSPIIVKMGGKTVTFVVGGKKMKVNGKESAIQSAPEVKDGLVMLPLEVWRDGMGLKVNWEQLTHTLKIQTK